MVSRKYKVLIVDDEKSICDFVTEALSDKYDVHQAHDGEAGISLALQILPDLILLDINMPKADGLTVCRTLRSDPRTRHVGILMLTAMNSLDDRLQAFHFGADDFLAKPFRVQELVARVDSKIRRLEESSEPQQTVTLGNLTLHMDRAEATINGQACILSMLEFKLLSYFVQNNNKLLSRNDVLQSVWQDTNVQARTVDTHIGQLRKKLRGFNHKIATVYGGGYIMKERGPGEEDTNA